MSPQKLGIGSLEKALHVLRDDDCMCKYRYRSILRDSSTFMSALRRSVSGEIGQEADTHGFAL